MRLLAGLIIFVCAFLSGIQQTSAETGVTDTEIKLGTHLALTGPAAMVGQPILDGYKLAIAYLNDRGGIHGRTLSIVAEDDAFLPSRAKEAVKKLVFGDKVFAILGPLQGAGILAAEPDIMSNKVPVLFFMAATDDLTNPTRRYIFGYSAPYHVSTAIQVDWAVKRLGKKRIAFVNQWGPSGEANTRGAKKRLEKYGLELSAEEILQNVEMDYSGLVARLRAKEIECVVITTTAQWTIPLLKEIERQGWKPEVIVGHGTGDPVLIKKMAGTAAEGIYVTMMHLPLDYDDPFINEYRDVLKRYSPGQGPAQYNFIGYGVTRLLATALQQVGRELTREKLIDTLESWKGFESGFVGKISYSPTDHEGQEGMVLVQIKGGETKVIEPRIYPLP